MESNQATSSDTTQDPIIPLHDAALAAGHYGLAHDLDGMDPALSAAAHWNIPSSVKAVAQ